MRAIRGRIRREGGGGFVLVVVLVIVALLALILMEFSHETNLGLEVSGNSYAGERARNCAEAGIAVALAAVRQYADPLQDNSLRPLLDGKTAMPVGEGTCTITLSREDGRLNINLLKTRNHVLIRPRVERLLRLVDLLNAEEGRETPISYGTVAAMVDWVDPSDDVTVLPWVHGDSEGAKNDYYLSLTPPYLCKNAPFDSLDELLMVKGMNREILDGRPGDPNADIKPLDGMRDCLTVYGDGMIDINQAPSLVLQALSPEINENLAQAITDQRSVQPFQAVQQLRLVTGMTQAAYDAIKNDITVFPRSRHYRILSVGNVNGIEVQVQVMIKVQGSNKDLTVLLRKEL